MKYAFIERNRHHWPILVLCEVLEVNSSGFHQRRQRAAQDKPQHSRVSDGMAWFRRRPDAGMIAHSDRGSQYCGGLFQDTLKAYGIRSSMSPRGDCWGNAHLLRTFRLCTGSAELAFLLSLDPVVNRSARCDLELPLPTQSVPSTPHVAELCTYGTGDLDKVACTRRKTASSIDRPG